MCLRYVEGSARRELRGRIQFNKMNLSNKLIDLYEDAHAETRRQGVHKQLAVCGFDAVNKSCILRQFSYPLRLTISCIDATAIHSLGNPQYLHVKLSLLRPTLVRTKKTSSTATIAMLQLYFKIYKILRDIGDGEQPNFWIHSDIFTVRVPLPYLIRIFTECT